jgi:dTDP-4-amino-4,6-dideoxygalactose transaminase
MLNLDAQRRSIGSILDDRISRVLNHGKFIMGPEVQELEEALSERAGVRHVVSCGNGTDALQLALMAWGVGPGDAVFVPSFTFTATAEVVALLGATPVFCDVHHETFNLDVASLEAAVQRVVDEGKLRPRAVIPVDLFGLPAAYDRINTAASRLGLRVLGDAAQSFGATLDERPVGSLAEATATSFFPSKPLGCFGDGGAVFTDDDDLADLMRSIRVHGKGSDKYDTVRVGVNSRLDTLQAAILLAKLTVFDAEIRTRQHVADAYTERLAGTPGFATPPRESSAWAQYTVRIGPDMDRDRVARLMGYDGVPTAVYYPRALHDQPAYKIPGGHADVAPESRKLATSVLSLPMHPYLTTEQIDHVAAAAIRVSAQLSENYPASAPL